MPIQIATEAQYQTALTEAMRLGQENETQHLPRQLELGDAIDAYEIQQGHEPAAPPTCIWSSDCTRPCMFRAISCWNWYNRQCTYTVPGSSASPPELLLLPCLCGGTLC